MQERLNWLKTCKDSEMDIQTTTKYYNELEQDFFNMSWDKTFCQMN